MKSTTLTLLVLLLIGSSYTSVFAQFTASNFKFVGLDAKRRAKTADAFPQKPLKQVELTMDIAAIENSDTSLTKGTHEMYLVLTAPDGKTIVNLNSNQSNIPFNYQGKSMISTTRSIMNYTYSPEGMRISILYLIGAPPLPVGDIQVKIYCLDAIIGETSFRVY